MRLVKLISFFFISCCILNVAAQPVFNNSDFDKIIAAEQQAASAKLLQSVSPIINNYDIKYHRFNWQIDPAVEYISGSVFTYFKTNQLPADSIQFNLSTSLLVDSVIYHHQKISYHQYAPDILNILFPVSINQNTLDSVTVFYQGVPQSSGFGSFIQDEHDGVPIIWTLSEPYGASEWWPCKNTLNDKIDSIDMYITVPNGNRAAGNGVLKSSIVNGAYTTYHWSHRYPIVTYLIATAVTNYIVSTSSINYGNTVMPIVDYIFPEDSAAMVNGFKVTIPVMHLFDSLFGQYPFAKEKYGHAQFGWGGGMEHQTMSFMGNASYELVNHELAHQWFGNKITCASWEDIWLNEGFASYLTGLCYEYFFDKYYWIPFKKDRIGKIIAQPGGSVLCTDTTTVNRVFSGRLSYAKGAMIMHQLRWVIGDSAFFKGVTNYLNDPALAFQFAKTYHLKQHLEASSGQDLTWYFNDWYVGEGYPNYQINWNQQGGNVSITVNQIQSHPSVDFFELPLEIKLKNTNKDTILRLNHNASGQTFTIPVSFTVDSLIFNSNYNIISGNNLITSIQNLNIDSQLLVYPNPANDVIYIVTTTANDYNVVITDLLGKEVLRNANEKQLNISGLSKGIYILSVIEKETQKFVKIVKE